MRFYYYIVFATLLILTSCIDKEAEVNWDELHETYSISRRVNLIHSTNSQLDYTLQASIIRPYKQNNDIDEFVKGFNLITYTEHNQISSDIKANYGLFYKIPGLMKAEKGVVINTSKKEVIKTSYINWNQQKNNMYTDAPVSIETNRRMINGRGLESKNGLQEFNLKSVSGTIYLDQ